MSSHPLTRYEEIEIKALATHEVKQLEHVPERGEVLLGGLVSSLTPRTVKGRNGQMGRMAKIIFEDLTGSTPALLWAEDYAKFKAVLQPDALGFIKGTLERRRDPPEVIVTRFIPLERAPLELATGIMVALRTTALAEADVDRLRRWVAHAPGPLALF